MTQLTRKYRLAKIERNIQELHMIMMYALDCYTYNVAHPDNASPSNTMQWLHAIRQYEELETKLNKQHAELMQC